MKICVIGGTGNISTSIVKCLLKQKHEVFCFNRGQSGSVPEGSHSIIGDRNDQESLKAFAKSNDECVDHQGRSVIQRGKCSGADPATESQSSYLRKTRMTSQVFWEGEGVLRTWPA